MEKLTKPSLSQYGAKVYSAPESQSKDRGQSSGQGAFAFSSPSFAVEPPKIRPSRERDRRGQWKKQEARDAKRSKRPSGGSNEAKPPQRQPNGLFATAKKGSDVLRLANKKFAKPAARGARSKHNPTTRSDLDRSASPSSPRRQEQQIGLARRMSPPDHTRSEADESCKEVRRKENHMNEKDEAVHRAAMKKSMGEKAEQNARNKGSGTLMSVQAKSEATDMSDRKDSGGDKQETVDSTKRRDHRSLHYIKSIG